MRFSAGVQQEFVQLCPSQTHLNRTLKNLPNYNQHLNGISFYYIIVTLKYINFDSSFTNFAFMRKLSSFTNFAFM